MGSKDKGHREMKKPKKDSKKPVIQPLFEPTAEVEVIKKKRKDELFE